MMLCKHCGKECKNKNSLAQHEIRCKLNPDRLNYPNGMLGKKGQGSNQYIKAATLGYTATMSADTKLKLSKIATGKYHTPETKLKLSKIAIENCLGGHTSKLKLNYIKSDGTVVYLHTK